MGPIPARLLQDKFRLALEIVFAGYVLVCLLLEAARMVYAPEIGFSVANVAVYFAKWSRYLDLARLALFVWFLSSCVPARSPRRT